ncbi:MAG TPA: hypothetical protein V6C72_02765 [Chroococcales cyanobacterium]
MHHQIAEALLAIALFAVFVPPFLERRAQVARIRLGHYSPGSRRAHGR